jgi:hypothetical protein
MGLELFGRGKEILLSSAAVFEPLGFSIGIDEVSPQRLCLIFDQQLHAGHYCRCTSIRARAWGVSQKFAPRWAFDHAGKEALA